MCFAVKDFICVEIFRCLRCKKSRSDSPERCSHSSVSSPKVRLRKFSSRTNSYELFSDEMGSNRTGEINCNKYSEDGEKVSMTRKSISPAHRNGTDTPSRQSPQTPEYVKRTARLFETVQITETVKNGERETFVSESRYETSEEGDERKTDAMRISLDCLDGEYNRKPSYVGVSCSNSGYRNVINYDSKLREGFWSANSQRESLVLSNSRLRDSSPLRRDFNFKSQQNGWSRDVAKVAEVRIEKEAAAPVNGVSRPEKFVNISTSTKTISTFRSSKDLKADEAEKAVNGSANGNESKVNLKQILNGRNNEPYRRGYNNLGFSPKILKSPEKNCNSFLKSISSFENNCKKSDTGRSTTTTTTTTTTYAKPEERVYDSSGSIQQRIERLYGPGALVQGFYTQKPHPKTEMLDKANESSSDGGSEISHQNKPQTPVASPVNSTTVQKAAPPAEAALTENYSNGHSAPEPVPEPETEEKNGRYFLRLLKKETDRLEQLARFAESELENGENLPEETSGKLRAAAGKARLLVCQKLQQFEGLCYKNLNEKPGEQFRTTSEDLAGFWDMVMLQVVQVRGVFDELEQLKKNNWKAIPTKKEPESPAVTNGQVQPAAKMTPRKSPPSSATAGKPNQKSESAKKVREEGRRKLLEERRKKMKELKENKIIGADNEVEIFAK